MSAYAHSYLIAGIPFSFETKCVLENFDRFNPISGEKVIQEGTGITIGLKIAGMPYRTWHVDESWEEIMKHPRHPHNISEFVRNQLVDFFRDKGFQTPGEEGRFACFIDNYVGDGTGDGHLGIVLARDCSPDMAVMEFDIDFPQAKADLIEEMKKNLVFCPESVDSPAEPSPVSARSMMEITFGADVNVDLEHAKTFLVTGLG